MFREVRAATFVLVIASPAYRQRAEGDAPKGEGLGVQWEAALIREEVYADPDAALKRFLPVVLPGRSARDIPGWLGPRSRTHYRVTDFTVGGAEKLLRRLTGQPYESTPPLGRVPSLPARKAPAPTGPGGEASRDALLRRLTDRRHARDDATIQADLRQLLLVGDLGLQEQDLGAEIGSGEGRQRIDIAAGATTIEVRSDLHDTAAMHAVVRRLADQVTARSEQTAHRYAAVITNGAEWRLYHNVDDGLQLVQTLTVGPGDTNPEELLPWLEGVLGTGVKITPSPHEIRRRLGAGSPAHALDTAEVAAIYARNRDLPSVRVKRAMWARLLVTAMGTNFTDDDALFVDHTLLVAMAEVIAHAVVGLHPEDPSVTAEMMMSGARFTEAQIGGVVEADFFDWIVEVPGGGQFVKTLAKRLTRFAWERVEHDVMKVLYESIIPADVRHRLGEYYTPDWLAEEIVSDCITDPLHQKTLDASCGSGTFLFHAVRHYLAAADAAGQSTPTAITGALKRVFGFDVHPVAVTLARVTYLLAIGMDRLQAEDRPELAVPVYLGDSLRWGQETTLVSETGLNVPTADGYEIYADRSQLTNQLHFPDRVVADADRFDRLVGELADRAISRKKYSAVPSLKAVFRRFGIHPDDQTTLQDTFVLMCALHDEGRDHIWGYYIRNLARPLWLARSDNRADVLIGNPPWLAYRYMTTTQKASFRAMSTQRGLWAGATVATHQDLSALFVARCIELYLRPGGRFGFVMPLAVLSRRQYAGFRAGTYPVRAEPVTVAFDRPCDLHRIKPAFFPVPASIVTGRRQPGGLSAKPLDAVPDVWHGRFATATASRAEAVPKIHKDPGEPPPPPPTRASPYAARFSQGATATPRFLFLVERTKAGPLGSGAGRWPIRSQRTSNEKQPWKRLTGLTGTVERRFIRSLYLGESVLPFLLLAPAQAVIPWDRGRLLSGHDDQLDLYPGLAKWWRAAESVWNHNRSSDDLSLAQRLDFRKGLSRQFPSAEHRVIYTKSGMYMAAAIVSDRAAVIDHKLYWANAVSVDEARYLTAILNSTTLTNAVRPLQARGEHNPRDFDKYVFQLSIPPYEAADAAHQLLVRLAARAETVAAQVDLPMARFEAQRRRVREALDHSGIGPEIDATVKTLLA